jgi:transglutaminase-like putative cysteine protease/Flp pilus assembly protein TadD
LHHIATIQEKHPPGIVSTGVVDVSRHSSETAALDAAHLPMSAYFIDSWLQVAVEVGGFVKVDGKRLVRAPFRREYRRDNKENCAVTHAGSVAEWDLSGREGSGRRRGCYASPPMTRCWWYGLLFVFLCPRARAVGFDDELLAARRAELHAAGARPDALLPLLELEELWDLVDDRESLETFLREANANAKIRPEVRAEAALLLMPLAARAGHSEEVAVLRKQLGLVTDLWFVGPFENEGHVGHTTVYDPEKSLGSPIRAERHFSGRIDGLTWRRSPRVTAGGTIDLSCCLRPEGPGTAYLTTFIHVPRTMPTAIRLGSSGPVKVWVGRCLVLDRDVPGPLRFDQDVAPAQLAAGWNRLTIKLSTDEGAPQLILRLTAPDGRSIPELELTRDLPTPLEARFADSGASPRFAFAGLRHDLEAARRAAPRDPARLAALGRYLVFRGRSSDQAEAAHLLAEAARRKPTASTYIAWARTEPDPNDQAQILEEGLRRIDVAASPLDRAMLLSSLGDVFVRARRERRAEHEFHQALAVFPGYWPAALQLIRLEADLLPRRASAGVDALLERHPALALIREAAGLAERRGHFKRAEALYRRLLQAEGANPVTIRALGAVLRASGRPDEALALLAKLEEPSHRLDSVYEQAELLETGGHRDEALLLLQRALEEAPEEARLVELFGRCLYRSGQKEAGLKHLRRALELHPQNPDLRSFAASLEPNSTMDLAKRFGQDARALASNAPILLLRENPARVLLDQNVVRVLRNGLTEQFHQRVVEIVNERGAHEQDEFEIQFTPDTQSINLRAARVFKKGGDVVEAAIDSERDLSEPWYGLYYDVKAKVVRFPGLEPGDVIDIEYTLSDIARQNQLADYFGDLHFFQEEIPRIESRYVVIAPKARALYFNQTALAGLLRSEEEMGDEHLYQFVARNTPKIEVEERMPGLSELSAYLHVSSYRNWQEVAAFYRGLIREQLEPNEAIRSAAQEAVRGRKDDRAKIRAIYDLVVSRTRYVGLEFGIHGYKPYKVAQVFARKFGDCKDKASLLVAMLKAVGIDATLVLARTRRGGDLDRMPASLAVFDHAIVYVPKYRLFLDGTAEFSGSGDLPAQDQDIPVLLVDRGEWMHTPVLPTDQNQIVSNWQIDLETDGSAQVREQVAVTGEEAHEWRMRYQAAGERLDRYAKFWNGKYPGATVEKVAMPDLLDLERPVAVTALVRVPHLARKVGWGASQRLLVPALAREPDLLRNYARLSERRHSLELDHPFVQREEVTFHAPTGWKSHWNGKSRRILRSAFGQFELSFARRETDIKVVGQLRLDRHRISKSEYTEFRQFCASIDAALNEELVWRPALAPTGDQ